jgi:hypothetical protein
MGEMHRAVAREDRERLKQDRFASTLVISSNDWSGLTFPLQRFSVPLECWDPP